MVYESADHIWYSKSLDNGANWSAEQCISTVPWSEYAKKHRTPSLTYQYDGNWILIVWESQWGDETGDDRAIYFRGVNASNSNSMTGVETVADNMLSEPPASVMATPVVAFGTNSANSRALFIWHDPTDQTIKARTRGATGSYGTTVTLMSSVPAWLEFSLAPISAFNVPWQFTWADGPVVSYAPIYVSASPSLGPIENLMGMEGVGAIHTPTIVNLQVGEGTPGVAWAENIGGFDWDVIKYRRRHVTGGWNGFPTDVFTGGDYVQYTTPSLSGNDQVDDIALVWRTDAHTLMYAMQQGLAWSDQAKLMEGIDPMVSIGYNPNSSELALSRGTGSPYPIQQGEISFNSDGPSSLTTSFTQGRGAEIGFPQGKLRVSILEARLNSVPLPFVAMSDTVPVRNLGDLESIFRTEPIRGSGVLTLKLLYAATTGVPKGATFNLLLEDAQTGQPIRTLRTIRGHRDSIVTLTIPYDFGNRATRVAVKPVSVANYRSIQVERWFTQSEDSSSSQAKIAALGPGIAVPTEFALHQNYPNPFNPTTEIRFDLPDAGNVSLVVFDVLGRKIAEPVSGYREAGYHSAIWNASGQASGVYLARFTATDVSGKVRLAKTNKLILMK
jgi:hypothetical protein